ncbi:MAG: hypothetical protein O3C18_06080 [Bacteroidetes bacterium]|nr:hypothetical protein [Bacteroidota bacterium]
MKCFFTLALALVAWHAPGVLFGQDNGSFPFSVEVTAVDLPDMPGVHSFAQAQHEGKWLILGGRLDGLHARQPFNAFPAASHKYPLWMWSFISLNPNLWLRRVGG